MDALKSIDCNLIASRMLSEKTVFGSVFAVENRDGSFRSVTAAGDMGPDRPYFIASVTKLYVSALILVLMNEGKLGLDDPVVRYLGEERLRGLHVVSGVDHTPRITLRHLLSNQSGLRDYFYYEDGGDNAVTALNERDEAWPLDRVIERVKGLKPLYEPGKKGKVNYSDTNFRLLGGVIEAVAGMPVGDAFRERLFKPLGLKRTFAYDGREDDQVAKFYYGRTPIHAPRYMASVTADGGIVSTAAESMAFLKAFFGGFFFPAADLEILKSNYRMIMFPGQFYFGTGIEKLWVPRLLSLRRPVRNLVGFWGQTGAFAFCHEDTGLFFTGTVNQANGFGHGKAFKAMLAVIKRAMAEGARA